MEKRHKTHIVLLSGGSGRRLWPLSNYARSKQFLKVLRNEEGKPQSMLQRTLGKLKELEKEVNLDITIAACDAQAASIGSQTREMNLAHHTVYEPSRRDTAPAIMLSGAYLALEKNMHPDDTVVVMPVDTYADDHYYEKILAIDEAVQTSESDLILLGVEPTHPSEKFGYIICESGSSDKPLRKVTCFKEKPYEDTARELIEQGALWNAGVFGFKLSFIMEILNRHISTQKISFQEVVEKYEELPKNSFDYEVVEKTERISVIPYKGMWKDLGTWGELSGEMHDTEAGRVICDEESENTHVINELNIPLLTLGVKNAIVVATPDGILVADRDRSAQIKPYVARISETRPMYELRQWGEYRVLDQEIFSDGTLSLEKKLIIFAGKQISYQRHLNRSEVWTVTDGSGWVVLDGFVQNVSKGSVINIAPGMKHAIKASSSMRIIEVQLGIALSESDIERFGFWWPEENSNDEVD